MDGLGVVIVSKGAIGGGKLVVGAEDEFDFGVGETEFFEEDVGYEAAAAVEAVECQFG